MNITSLRRLFGLALLVLLTVTSARAEYFNGWTFIDFNARGYANYNITISSSVTVGGNLSASAWATFGPIVGQSNGTFGEASVYIDISGIHKVGAQWVASSVRILELYSDASGYGERTYSDFVLPNSATASGSATCNGYTQDISGQVDGWGAVTNEAPVAAVSVNGRTSGATVGQGTTATIHFSATDANGNLSGIRYNIWNATTGYFDNNGTAFAPQSGSSGDVVKTISLSSAGDWYFWTDAQDSQGLTATSGAWGSGFRLTVVASPTYCTPAYEPTYWNNNSIIRGNNNCYNYANNRRTDTFAQPGRATGAMYTSITASQVSNGAISDGLEPTTATAVSPSGKTKIALVIWPGVDYHWYRQDRDGRWTHKPGSTPATNLDNSGRIITNPETANRGGYTQFVGYYFTPSDCVQGQGHANIN